VVLFKFIYITRYIQGVIVPFLKGGCKIFQTSEPAIRF
jgi:hypothetical protein